MAIMRLRRKEDVACARVATDCRDGRTPSDLHIQGSGNRKGLGKRTARCASADAAKDPLDIRKLQRRTRTYAGDQTDRDGSCRVD